MAVEIIVPVTAIVFTVSAGMLTTWASHKRKQQVLEQNHRERMTALDKGLPPPDLPAGLLDGLSAPSFARALRSGLALVMVGTLLFSALGELSGDKPVGLLGLIPAAIGVANLVYAWVLQRHPPDPNRGGGSTDH